MVTPLASPRLQHMLESITTYMEIDSYKGAHEKTLPRFLYYTSKEFTLAKLVTPGGGCKEPELANNETSVETETPVGALLLNGLTFTVNFVGDDKVLEEFDRVLATCRMEDGTNIFQIGLHAPKGSMAKGHTYSLGAKARIKRIIGNRAEIYISDTDPAAGVNYSATTEVEELPF